MQAASPACRGVVLSLRGLPDIEDLLAMSVDVAADSAPVVVPASPHSVQEVSNDESSSENHLPRELEASNAGKPTGGDSGSSVSFEAETNVRATHRYDEEPLSHGLAARRQLTEVCWPVPPSPGMIAIPTDQIFP